MTFLHNPSLSTTDAFAVPGDLWSFDRYWYKGDPESLARDNEGQLLPAYQQTEARENGINCKAFGHLFIKEMYDISLPTRLHVAELYHDEEFFEHISPDHMQRGDLVLWTRPKNLPALKDHELLYDHNDDLIHYIHMHLTCHMGTHHGEEYFMHINHRTNGVTLSTKEYFASRKYPKVIARAKRLQASLREDIRQTFLLPFNQKNNLHRQVNPIE